MDLETLVNIMAFGPWKDIYYFIFQMPWDMKIFIPIDLGVKAIEHSIWLSKKLIEDTLLFGISVILVLIVNIWKFNHEKKIVNRYGYFTLLNVNGPIKKILSIIWTLAWIPLAPFWPIYFITKKAVVYVTITYALILIDLPIYLYEKTIKSFKINKEKTV